MCPSLMHVLGTEPECFDLEGELVLLMDLESNEMALKHEAAERAEMLLGKRNEAPQVSVRRGNV